MLNWGTEWRWRRIRASWDSGEDGLIVQVTIDEDNEQASLHIGKAVFPLTMDDANDLVETLDRRSG